MAKIWIAEPEDLDEVTELLIGFRDHQNRDWPGDSAFARNVAILMADPNTEFVLGTSSGGESEGIVVLRFRHGAWRDGVDCLVEDVFVEQSARGSGLGRELMNFVLARAKARKAKRLELDVNEANDPALALYRSLGFSERYSPEAPRDLYMRLHLD